MKIIFNNKYKCFTIILVVIILFIGCLIFQPKGEFEDCYYMALINHKGDVEQINIPFSIPECINKDHKGNLLIADSGLNNVSLYTKHGKLLWKYIVKAPKYVEETFDNHFLIATNNKLVEIDNNQHLIWQSRNFINILQATKIADNYYYILLAEQVEKITENKEEMQIVNKISSNEPEVSLNNKYLTYKNKIIEIDRDNKILWETLPDLNADIYCNFQTLPANNFLITDRPTHRVIEINKKSEIVYRLFVSVNEPYCALKLSNGSYFISDRASSRIWFYDQYNNLKTEFTGLFVEKATLLQDDSVGIVYFKVERKKQNKKK